MSQSSAKFYYCITLLGMMILISLMNVPMNSIESEYGNLPDSQTITPISYDICRKYVDDVQKDFEILNIQDIDSKSDRTELKHSTELLPRFAAIHASDSNNNNPAIDGSSLSETLRDDDLLYVHNGFDNGEQYLQIEYANDHLTQEQRQNLNEIIIDFKIKMYEFPISSGDVLKSNNLRLIIIFNSGETITVYQQDQLLQDIPISYQALIINPIIINRMKAGDYIKYIKVQVNIQNLWWAHKTKIMIDKIVINYDVNCNFNINIRYDFYLPNNDLEFITTLITKIKYNSGAYVNVSILKTDGTPYLLIEQSKGGQNIFLIELDNPSLYLCTVGGIPNVISIIFKVEQYYVTTDILDIFLDYIGFEFDESNPPSLNVLSPNPAITHYFNYVPAITAEANDASFIQSVVVKHSDTPFTMVNIGGIQYQLSASESSWRNYFNSLTDGAYTFQVIANDTHLNSKVVDLNIVKDFTNPEITIDLPPYAGNSAPVVSAIINETNIETISLNLNNGTSFTTFLTFNSTHWVLDPSCTNWAVYQEFWQNSQDITILYTVICTDKANNQNQTSQTIQKDTTAPQISIITPSPLEEIKFTPAVIVEISDPAINMSSVKLNLTYSLQYYPGSLNWFALSPDYGDWTAWDMYFKAAPIGSLMLNLSSMDCLGNFNWTTITVYKIDNIPPTLIPLSNDTNWHKDPVYVSAYAEDYNLDQVWYCIDTDPTQYPVNTTISDSVWNSLNDGIHTITLFANDTSGNYAIVEYELKIDRAAPVIANYYPAHLSAWNQPPPIRVVVNDVQSHPDLQIFYEIGGQRFAMQNNTPIIMNQAIWDSYSTGFYITIIINATDSLGFSTKTEFSILKDILPPLIQLNTLNYTVFFEAVPELSYSANEEVTLSIGYNGIIIDFNSKWPTLPYGLHVFQLNFTDQANNIIKRELRLYKNDTIAPVLIANYPQSGDFAGEQPPMVSISAFDLTLKRIMYIVGTDVFIVPFNPGLTSVDLVFTIDASAWDNAYNETTTIRIIAQDAYGNTQEVQVTLIRSDWAGAHSKDGLGLGLFLDMSIEMWILMGATFGITVLTSYLADKRRKTL